MKHIIEPQISNYIDVAIERQRAVFSTEVDHKIDTAIERERKIFSDNIDHKIDTTIERERKIFNADMKHTVGLALEKFQSDLKLMGETVDLKIRETTREVIREEVTPRFELLETKMDMVVSEIRIINGELKKYRTDTDNFTKEMRSLRMDSNRHDKRLTRLEHAIL